MLSEVAVRQAKPKDKDYKLSDSEGLYLYVTKTGKRSWRLKYRFAGKERRLVFGAYALTGIPVWATLGNERFGLVSMPDSVTELHLFVDHDAGGELAVSRGLAAYARDGRTIHVRKPSSSDTDWNDELTAWLRRKAAP
ncbi:MAG: integrase arm-type DNA-binding domain-containing protein [Alteraurantiacibacter sp.]